jgi:hypothetical protein
VLDLPIKIDLSKDDGNEYMPKISINGSPTSGAMADVIEYEMNSLKISDYNTICFIDQYIRRIDAVESIRQCIKGVSRILTRSWTHDPEFSLYDNPFNKIKMKYYRIGSNILEFKNALSQHYLIIFGISVPCENSILHCLEVGSHVVVAYGYDDDLGLLLIRNNRGMYSVSYKAISNLYCDDCWVISLT